jgi:hypothetical protein
LVDSTLWKWPYYQKQSTCSMKSLPKFQQHWRISPKIHMETQNTSNSQRNSEQKVQCWRYYNTQLHTILQSHNNKNSMVWAQKQTWKQMDLNRRSRHTPMQL